MAMVQVVEKFDETIDRRTAAWAGVVLLIIGYRPARGPQTQNGSISRFYRHRRTR